MNAALILSAIFNGAWQGALLCLGALLTFRLFRRLNATTMFTVWSVLLAIAVLLPVANYVFAPGVVRVAAVPVMDSAGVALRQAQGDKGPVQGDKGRVQGDKGRVGASTGSAVLRQAQDDKGVLRQAQDDKGVVRQAQDDKGVVRQAQDDTIAIAQEVFAYAGWILAVLALVALVRLALLARDIVLMLRARARVRAIEAPVDLADGIDRPFLFAASDEFTSPCVLGFAPPLIVIPEELLADASARLTSVVLHEREHVRRFDDIQNVLQRFVGALAFFCPGVRIALRELALYREQICDDAAVNATGDRVSYAMTLTGMAQWAQGRGAPVPSLIFKRKHLMHRLEVLLDSAVSHSMRMNRRFAVAAATALVVAAALVLRLQVPVIAETISPAAVRASTGSAVLRQAQHDTKRAPREMGHRQQKTLAKIARVAKATIAPVAKARVAPVAKAKVAPVVKVQVRESKAVVAVAPQAAARAMPVSAVAMSAVAYAPPVVAPVSGSRSEDLMDALNAAGLQNLPVDQLIALRDHGVSARLVQSAVSYFGHVGANDLTYLADHGVGPTYIATLRASGVSGISPQAAVQLMDHGVSAPLISAAMSYFTPRPSAADLVQLADHGVTGAYIMKIRRVNAHATIDDIIRLHDAGF